MLGTISTAIHAAALRLAGELPELHVRQTANQRTFYCAHGWRIAEAQSLLWATAAAWAAGQGAIILDAEFDIDGPDAQLWVWWTTVAEYSLGM